MSAATPFLPRRGMNQLSSLSLSLLRTVSSLIFKTMHKRDPLRDTVYALVRIRGHFVPRREPRTYFLLWSFGRARAFARARVYVSLEPTHTRATRVSRRSIRLINSFICPPSGTLACARRCISRHYRLTRSMMSCETRASRT